MDVSLCCHAPLENAEGYLCCTNCGKLQRQHLETSCTSFSHKSYFMPRGYSRRSRFVKKVLGALRLIASHNIDPKLLTYLKKQNINKPEDLLTSIGSYSTKGRRPYQFAMYYWKALGKPLPRCTDRDVDLLIREFDEILFAWERHRFKNPKFPYSYLFRQLVENNSRYSDGIKKFVPFVRQLRCAKRKERYDKLFKICSEFEYKNLHITYEMDNSDVDTEINKVEPTSKGQQIFYREICSGKRRNVYDTPGIYKSQREIDEAIKRGDFNIAKTMYVAPNGEFYFLCYENGNYVKDDVETKKQGKIPVQNVQIQNTQSLESYQASKLDQLLCEQNAK